MKYEKQVAAATLKSLHQVHVNFSKTLLKNMHSYIHNQKSEDCFKRVVQLLPLASQSLNMELLELYLTILSKLLNDLILLSSKKHHSLRKRRRFAILKIVLTAMLECSTNFTILRE
jgi:hypothetical protein